MASGNVEQFDVDLAAVILAVASVQAWFVGDEGEGMRGTDGVATADDTAGVGIEAAGNVDGEYRTTQAVDIGDTIAQLAIGRSRQANAEQAIEHQIPWL